MTKHALWPCWHVARPAHLRLKGAGRGADAALEIGLVRKSAPGWWRAVGVVEARILEPVGQVHLLLDASGVKLAVRKAVDRKDVQPLALSRATELFELALRELLRGPGREPKPTPKGDSRTTALTPATSFSTLPRTSAQVSPAWMLVQYVRCGSRHAPSFIASLDAREPPWRAPRLRISCTSTPEPISASSVMVSSPPRCSRNSARPASTAGVRLARASRARRPTA